VVSEHLASGQKIKENVLPLQARLPPITATSHCFLVGAAGLEPATTGLEIRCSIQLSYAPTFTINTLQVLPKIRWSDNSCMLLFLP